MYGGCALTCYPLTLELVVETQFPAPEATAAGLVFLVGQIVGAATLIIADLLAREPSTEDLRSNTCGLDGAFGGSIGEMLESGIDGGFGGDIDENGTRGRFPQNLSYATESINTLYDNSTQLINNDSPEENPFPPRDLTYSNVFLCVVASISCCIFTLMFRADYVRTREEKKMKGSAEKQESCCVGFSNCNEGSVEVLSIKQLGENVYENEGYRG